MANPNFIATYSSDEVYFGQNELLCITDVVNEKANLNHTHEGVYATEGHSHSGYASQSDLDLLEDVVATKANATHTHSGYASSSHTHSEYATQTALDTISDEVDSKADAVHTHIEYASISHEHTEYALSSHSHSGYAPSSHEHEEYATTISLNNLSTTVSGKANVSHTHNDIYYTETEIDTKLAGKANASHTHTDVYDANGAAANALTSANAYTDTAVANLLNNSSSAVDSIYELRDAMEENADAIEALETIAASKASATDLTSHTENTAIHVTSAEKSAWNAKSNFSGSYNDLTNKPTIPSISGLATETYVNSAVSAKANTSHTHTIANITNLQTTLDGKASSSHNHSGVYANVSHTHTASAIGAVAIGDVATVSEVETYLAI